MSGKCKVFATIEITMSLPRRLIALALSAALLITPTVASSDDDSNASSQQDQARDAVQRGLARPLEEVLTFVRKTVKGDIVEIELDDDDGRYFYEIEYVAPNGHLMEIKIDARTLDIISHGEEDDD